VLTKPAQHHTDTPDQPDEVLASLEPEQLVAAKARSFPRRKLTASETLLLFSLRLYLIFMIAVLIYHIWKWGR
jgi:hypothetical protein